MSHIVFRLVFNPCDTLPCINGTCNNNTATCACIAGYRGPLCEEGRLIATIVYVDFAFVSLEVYCMPIGKCCLLLLHIVDYFFLFECACR